MKKRKPKKFSWPPASPGCFDILKKLEDAREERHAPARALVDACVKAYRPKKSVRPIIHTSDSQSAPASDEYRANWERIFGRRS